MSQTTLIQVTKCDNELYIIAVPAAGVGSFEILHITSGFNNTVKYEVIPQSILPKGQYTLVMTGVNWGGPQGFTVNLTTNNVVVPNTWGAGAAVGAQSISVPITV